MSNPHSFIIGNKYKELEKYLSDGGNPNAKESSFPENTLLMDAVMANDFKIIELLLDYNADPYLKCGDGKTPIDIIEYKLERNPTDKTSLKIKKALNEKLNKAISSVTRGYRERTGDYSRISKTIKKTRKANLKKKRKKKKNSKKRKKSKRR